MYDSSYSQQCWECFEMLYKNEKFLKKFVQKMIFYLPIDVSFEVFIKDVVISEKFNSNTENYLGRVIFRITENPF